MVDALFPAFGHPHGGSRGENRLFRAHFWPVFGRDALKERLGDRADTLLRLAAPLASPRKSRTAVPCSDIFLCKKNIAVARGRHGATRAGRHRHGGTGRHRRGATGGATRGSARALPPIFPRWPCNARHAGPGKIARSAPDRGESCAQRARSGDKNSEKNSKKFFERI